MPFGHVKLDKVNVGDWFSQRLSKTDQGPSGRWCRDGRATSPRSRLPPMTRTGAWIRRDGEARRRVRPYERAEHQKEYTILATTRAGAEHSVPLSFHGSMARSFSTLVPGRLSDMLSEIGQPQGERL